MCRLFGFLSQSAGTVHEELVTEKNSLRAQSVEHKDGWGIAYYDGGMEPEVARGLGAAHSDPDFERVSNLVTARAVVAHVRLASVGAVHLGNAHPFTYGPWVFAHNGTLREFDRHRAAFDARIAPRFRARLQGDTDSERCFYLFLTYLLGPGPADDAADVSVDNVARCLVRVAREACALTDAPGLKPSSTNFLVSDGRLMVATRHNRTLFYSERRDGHAGPGEAPTNGMPLDQFVIASEELSMRKHWHAVPEDSVVAVDEELRFRRWMFDELEGSGSAP